MYTRERGELPRLRAYHRELTARYHQAIARRDWAHAQRLYGLRRRVWVAVLWHEEWLGAPPLLPTGLAPVQAPRAS
jgi:hypothetical protein